ncbi:DegT/DnrJ/EryC1/StrS family aminotransferase [Pantoea sp.]|uniref:DegT/DnrJ/EryC1/StrS family aminotransferase n=1 Tax=Pantoea sp. TaxID=69393 RepID=UPI00391830E4
MAIIFMRTRKMTIACCLPFIDYRGSSKAWSLIGCNRDKLTEALQDIRILTRKYFYPELHKIKAFSEYSHTSLPVTETNSKSILFLPLYPELWKDYAEKLARALGKIQEQHS